jgi:hypothetical protein
MTYLQGPRYLELHGRCRLASQWPRRLLLLNSSGRVFEGDSSSVQEHPDLNLFACHPDDIVGFGLLKPAEYEEMVFICRQWFEQEIQRLEDVGMHDQAESIRRYMDS